MFTTDNTVEYCDGFKNGAFEMRSNISTVILKIKQMDSSDSGLYFCGSYTSGRLLFSEIYLKVKGKINVKSCILFGHLCLYC